MKYINDKNARITEKRPHQKFIELSGFDRELRIQYIQKILEKYWNVIMSYIEYDLTIENIPNESTLIELVNAENFANSHKMPDSIGIQGTKLLCSKRNYFPAGNIENSIEFVVLIPIDTIYDMIKVISVKCEITITYLKNKDQDQIYFEYSILPN